MDPSRYRSEVLMSCRQLSRIAHVGVRALLLLGGLLAFGADAIGQSRTTSALAGRVADETGMVLAGATVQIESDSLIGGSRVVSTDDQGRFHVADVPPGSYDIIVVLKGYKTVRIDDIQLSVGMSAEIPVRMTLYAGEETVLVQAGRVAIDPSSSSVPSILSGEFLRNIPLERDPSHLLDLAPGINIESAYGGAEESGNSYAVDGVDISDPQGGAPWSLFNQSILSEVQLVGLGAPAEYGQFTGVVVNSVTKSGGNNFSGSTDLFYAGKGLTSASSEDLLATIDSDVDGSLQIGGPLHKDKLWAFAAAQYVRKRSSEGGPPEAESTPRIFTKLTGQASQQNAIQGSLAWDHTKVTGRNGDAFTPLEAIAREDNPERVWSLSWNSAVRGDAVLDVAWTGYAGFHHTDPFNGLSTSGRLDEQTGLASGNARLFGAEDRNRNQINVSLSQHAAHLTPGDHQLKTGMEIERAIVHDRFGFPGGAFYTDNLGPDLDPSTRRLGFFTLGSFGGGVDARGTNHRLSLYAQDTWRLGRHLTFNPGVRMDLNRGVVAGTTVFATNPVAPRLGFAWALGPEGRAVIKGHYGRYSEALYAAYYYYMDPGAFEPLTTRRTFNASRFTETLTTVPGQQYAMTPKIRQPRLDQYLLGVERQLAHGLVLSGTLVHRRHVDLIETVSQHGIFVPVAGEIPDTGQRVTLFDHLNASTDVLVYTNPPGLERTYRAAILSVTRRFVANWQLDASYVYSRTRGNIDNLGSDESGLGGNTPFFDGRFLDTPNSLVNAQGRLTHDQAHQVKLQGTRLVPSWHMALSANYTFHSGDTWTPRNDCLLTDEGNGDVGDGVLGCHAFPQGPVWYFAEPRGSRRLPARNELDLRAEWRHDVGASREFHLDVDAFNVTNQSRATSVETLVGDQLGEPANVSFPRNIRLGLGFSW